MKQGNIMLYYDCVKNVSLSIGYVFHKVKLKYKLFLGICAATHIIYEVSLKMYLPMAEIYRCSSTNLPEKFVFMCLVGLNIILFPGQYIPSTFYIAW